MPLTPHGWWVGGAYGGRGVLRNNGGPAKPGVNPPKTHGGRGGPPQ